MSGPNSRWLGPKTRKRLFGSEHGGTPRYDRLQERELAKFGEQPGWVRGAKVRAPSE